MTAYDVRLRLKYLVGRLASDFPEQCFAVLKEGLTASHTILDDSGQLREVPDHAVRVAAAAALISLLED